jgi:hypothetical protein
MEACLIRDHTELGLGFRQWIPTGEQSGLPMHIAMMGSVLLRVPMKKLTAFVELERAIYGFAVDLIS